MTNYRVDKGVFYIPEDAPELPEQPGWKNERWYRAILNTVVSVLRLQGLKFYVNGLENMPADGPVLVAGNHIGYYDFVTGALPGLLRGRRATRYMAKKELFDHWLVGKAARGAGQIEVDRSRGADSVDKAIERLTDSDEVVGIFPEGTLARSFELEEFKTGAARIAKASGATLIPSVSWGTQRIWAKRGKVEMGRTKYPIITNIGPAVSTEGSHEEITARLKDAMQVLLDAAREEYNDRFGPFPEGLDWMAASMGGSAPTVEEAKVLDQREKAERKNRKERKKRKKG